MTHYSAPQISNSDDIIDSRDIIARIEELEANILDEAGGDVTDFKTYAEALEQKALDEDTGDENFSDDYKEWKALSALAKEAEPYSDAWTYGATLIRESYFVDYIEELINDCYEMPKGFNSSEWPWRHMKINFKAAAEEAKQDYTETDFDGVTYYIS